jgi:hypothetical protein
MFRLPHLYSVSAHKGGQPGAQAARRPKPYDIGAITERARPGEPFAALHNARHGGAMDVEGMIDRPEPNRLQSFGRTVNLAFFFVLLLIMGTVIYGLILRAVWEDSYYVAVAIAVLGAIVLLIGLAQEEIAARDKATLRAMAEWQLRAT